ncbi:MAG: class I SAM-dependent methyltransferase [Brevibacterium sp.]|uniref:class I SAM-dependent methyltransferase n=1 Tax=Actinomycetes TaxID=1760 RepID=UPI002647306C|nr:MULTISPECIES: class I SAM-dependent methyltransferase [Actinomycetes]MDN5756794.1 class I SAM-dependent methyltransferase [Micrococcaceae bacterium]MDN5808197.1 class I SAM-dependent methyltransferase [Brevibacterium sp.]MDN5880600.1 class I SAM-dependent methyltransferase [Micrococcaceae bacterium]MDN6382861.1 class I SAM-dependent methyltransferase [Corynebacterium casei]MDN6481464.1 class I SAM-dependent methyltransferase [Acidipropionibacterium jensenii]
MPHTQFRAPALPGADRPVEQVGGHWLLARVGKKVLRPGGRETTSWLLDQIDIPGHTVVEFAPGLGHTAREILDRGPGTYLGIDSDPTAVELVRKLLPDGSHRAIEADAQHTGLPDGCADAVLGEAMLTMHTDHHKLDIMREAARLLLPGGRYAIHEMGLLPNDLAPQTKDEIRKALARAIRVNARPLTVPEWTALAEEAGFEVVAVHSTRMGLLDPRRMIADEGWAGTARIIGNVIRQPQIRRRVMGMRKVFTDNHDHLAGLGMILVRTGG